uniref:HPS4 biogenesis of lysosomal organelles complex 3 subunit 2 n=1 Tax=Cyprinus carpio TaxID=7962 RepID=A0A8C1UEB9_CYPCA
MAETATLTDSRRFFFLYDSSKVQEEVDLTRDGIYYFSPEDTPIDQQELLCGQLAGVCRCVSELSSSPVRLLHLRKSKYAVRMKDKFLWLYSKEELALRWARYLCHLQGGSTELHHIFSCLRTIDSTHIDPLLLLKAALILQACQRCPLVLAGCILYRGRVVSTQMPPALTVKVMVYETQTYSQDFQETANGLSSLVGSPFSSTATTQVFLMPTELHMLRCPPVDRACRSHCNQPPCQPSRSRLLSRTLSDTPTTDTDSSSLDPTHCPPPSYQTVPSSPRSSLSDELCFSPSPSRVNTPIHSNLMNQSEYFTPDLHVHSTSNGTNLCAVEERLAGLNIKQDIDANSGSETKSNGLNSDQDIQSEEIKALANGYEQSNCLDNHSDLDNQIKSEENKLDANNHVTNKNGNGETEEEAKTKSKQINRKLKEKNEPTNTPSPHETLADTSLVPLVLYQHRVKGLVLALLVEPEFITDHSAREEVVRKMCLCLFKIYHPSVRMRVQTANKNITVHPQVILTTQNKPIIKTLFILNHRFWPKYQFIIHNNNSSEKRPLSYGSGRGLLVDYFDVYISCLDSHSDGTHSLQRISDGLKVSKYSASFHSLR